MIRVLVVDDHPVVRDGISRLLAAADDLEVVGEAESGPDAVELTRRLDPDVVVMDLRMPGGGGLDAIREIRRRSLRPAVLVLTTYDTDAETVLAVEAGATGYLLKDAPIDTLVAGVQAAAAGQTVLSPSVAGRLASHLHAPKRSLALSPREREVLTLVARGTANRGIAEELFVSEATVKTHLGHIYQKLGVTDRAAAVAAAYEQGLLG